MSLQDKIPFYRIVDCISLSNHDAILLISHHAPTYGYEKLIRKQWSSGGQNGILRWILRRILHWILRKMLHHNFARDRFYAEFDARFYVKFYARFYAGFYARFNAELYAELSAKFEFALRS